MDVARSEPWSWQRLTVFSFVVGFGVAMLMSVAPRKLGGWDQNLAVWASIPNTASALPYEPRMVLEGMGRCRVEVITNGLFYKVAKEHSETHYGGLLDRVMKVFPSHCTDLETMMLGKVRTSKLPTKSPLRIAPVHDIIAHFREVCSSGQDFHSTYEILGTVGQGSCGRVFKARHKVLGIERAVKRVKKHSDKHGWLKSELTASLTLDHPHIARLIEYFDDDRYFYLVFELCEGPDLYDRIVNSKEPKGRLNEYEAAVALRHILKACLCCHSHFRGHYDIKPENFMYSTDELVTLKMLDLGLSSGFVKDRNNNISGSIEYMAPEFWKGIYGPEGDVWSCGVVFFAMLSGTLLFQNVPRETMANGTKVRDMLKVRLTETAHKLKLSEDAEDLLTQMLQHDRHARPTVREILRHRFITRSYDFETVQPSRGIFQRDGRKCTEAAEIQASLPKIFRSVAVEPQLKRLVRLAMAFTVESHSSSPHRLCFRFLDRHGFGELSPAVMEDEFRKRRQPLPEDFRHLFEAIDLNGDGYISCLEFMAATLPPSVLFVDDRLCQCVFSMFDRDEDGYIDALDLAKVFGLDRPTCQSILTEVSSAGRLSGKQLKGLMCGVRHTIG